MPAEQNRFDPSIQTEDIAFNADQLVTCGKCSRQNPPNRLGCLYCGATLDVELSNIDRVTSRKLDDWESGVNLVITSVCGDLDAAARLLDMERERLEESAASGAFIPVARLEQKTAEIVSAKLREAGLETRSISDTGLDPTQPPVRLSGLDAGDEEVSLIDFNKRERVSHPWSDVRLIVTGSFSTGKIDSTEKRRRKGTTILSETATSTDESVFDLYLGDDTLGYRVQLAGFDYSCLADRMAPLAAENMSRLIDLIRSRASGLKIVDDYRSIRHLLTGIWDVESRKDPQGLKHVGFGKREFSVVHSTSNVEQFTRFSRLQRLML